METQKRFSVADFSYDLPENLIAQKPAETRDQSRLLCLNRETGQIEHKVFSEIINKLHSGDVLVMNNARVIPARCFARRMTGAKIEVFILDGWSDSEYRNVLCKPAKRVKPGEVLLLEDGAKLEVIQRNNKKFKVRLDSRFSWFEYLDRYGLMPLPPYIKRLSEDPRSDMDRNRYQTVFARHAGAVAAPTAGLHFTPHLLNSLQEKGVEILELTLWVGWGTFAPVNVKWISDHNMETEYYSVSNETARRIRLARETGKRIVAVGTTTTRALESWGKDNPALEPVERAHTSLFITPGSSFKLIDGLITNFHLPGSTLIMLVSAFAGYQKTMDAYKAAVARKYRFYSYGDAMFID